MCVSLWRVFAYNPHRGGRFSFSTAGAIPRSRPAPEVPVVRFIIAALYPRILARREKSKNPKSETSTNLKKTNPKRPSEEFSSAVWVIG
jgi:hypothetical protein